MNDAYITLLKQIIEPLIITQNNIIKYVNPAFIKYFGYSIEDVLDKNITDIIQPDRNADSDFILRNLKGVNFLSDFQFQIRKKDGVVKFIDTYLITSVWDNEHATVICIKDISDEKMMEITVRESKRLLYYIMRNLPDPTFVIDSSHHVIIWNRAMEDMTGIPAAEILGSGDYEYAIPVYGYKRPMLADMVLQPELELAKNYDYFTRTSDSIIAGRMIEAKNGGEKFMWLTSSILYDIFGNVVGAIQSFSPFHRSENIKFDMEDINNEKQILIKEIHHRVKNNMQLIYSLLDLQMTRGYSNSESNILNDCMSRIQSIAHVHDLLYRNERFTNIPLDDYIHELATSALYRFTPHNITINLDAKPVTLNIDKAIPCGLIINEVINNSLKHGFINDKSGILTIQMSLDGEPPYCNIFISDNGPGIPSSIDIHQPATFGLLLIKILTEQINGEFEYANTEKTTFHLKFPL
ncbi:MAG TPA: histidine kinase dimerization/phosphoacceptor domain -containing protein [Spirochaetota bacterium]|nr:histidine kinase dimerization/phosphoacceptor domain -containing protein [Spirochaetota bacterium]HRT77547.1 histidine kinase dimerization/phosphoacceptor domain -containing protein [Spirochaetota bacterium]